MTHKDPLALLKLSTVRLPLDVRRQVMKAVQSRPSTKRIANLLKETTPDSSPITNNKRKAKDHDSKRPHATKPTDHAVATPTTSQADPVINPNPEGTTNLNDKATTKRHRIDAATEPPPEPVNPITEKPNKTPIYVTGVSNTRTFLRDVATLLQSDIKAQIKGDTIQLIPSTPDHFKSIVSYLRTVKTDLQFHTFALPEDRTTRLLIKNLGRTMPPEDIKEELHELGFPVQHVMQLRTHRRQEGNANTLLPHFVVSINRGQKAKELRDITKLCGLQIQVETFNAPVGPVQCRNCHRWGHTQRYCGYTPRCSTCSGPHTSKECQAPRGQPQCCNCGGTHTATYKGCPKWKEAQTSHQKKRSDHKHPPPPPQSSTRSQPTTLLTPEQKNMDASWSHVVKGGKIIPSSETTSHTQDESPTTSNTPTLSKPTQVTVTSTPTLSKPTQVTVTSTPTVPQASHPRTTTPSPTSDQPNATHSTNPSSTPTHTDSPIIDLLPLLNALPESNKLELIAALINKYNSLPPPGPARTQEILTTVILYITYGQTLSP